MTDTEGNYYFDGLDEATPYFVAVQTMPDGFSSTGQSTDPTAADNDDDGAPAAGYASVSDVVTLAVGAATTGEADTVPAEDAEVEAADNGAFYSDGNSELSVDFGFIETPLYRLGNLVWDDENGDGLVDATEPGIEGVLVQLLDADADADADDVVIAESLTDADGEYGFENLIAGNYRVQIPTDQLPIVDLALEPSADALDGFLSSTNGEEVNADDDVDNNDNGLGDVDWASSDITLGSDPSAPAAATEPVDETDMTDGADDDPNTGIEGSYPDAQSNYSVDFGFYRLTLGNQVWLDVNDNGIADDGEAGIAGVSVDLYELVAASPTNPETTELVDTVETNETGLYLFTGLQAATEYVVEISATNFDADEPLENLFSSTDPETGAVDPDGDETIAGDGVDNDDNGADPTTQGDAVTAQPVLLTNGDEPLAEAPTNDDTSADTNSNLSVDFGFHNGLRIGNLVWIDDGNTTADDENGLADASESGADGVTVELYLDDGQVPGQLNSDDNTLVATTETANGGLYEFGHLAPGTYLVLIPQAELETGGDLAGHTSTLDGLADEATNNDDDGTGTADGATSPSGVVAGPIVLGFGEEPDDEGVNGTTGDADEDGIYADANSNLTIDFGFIETPLYRIGNLVFEDLDDDGIAEAGEPPLVGILVQLLDESGDAIAEVVTNDSGNYAFEDLEAGNYVVQIPSDQTATVDITLDPVDGALDGLVSSDSGEETNADDDVDNNDNGLGTSDWATSPISVGEGTLGGEPTDETLRADDPSDDDLDGSDGWPDARSNFSVDFGFYRLTLGNQVWFDVDGNGVADAGEPGLNGVAVELYGVDAEGELTLADTTETASIEGIDGIYSFDGLTNGDEYVVVVPAAELAEGGPLYGTYSTPDPAEGLADPDGDETTPAVDGDDSGQDPTGNAGGNAGDVMSLPVTLIVGDEPVAEDPATENAPVTNPDTNSNLTVDFGFVGLSLGDTVWFDLDENGIQDESEEGAEGVALELWSTDDAGEPVGDEALLATSTGDDGTYNFVGLVPGDYIVRVTTENFDPEATLDGWISTAGNGVIAPDPDDDVDADDNGDPSLADGWVQSQPISIDYGTEPDSEPDVGQLVRASNSTLDFGFVPTPPMSIGNAVWVDADNSGTIDADEPGMPDVLVELYSAAEDGRPDGTEPLATTTSDADGNYLFADLAPGEYVVVIPSSNFDEATDSLFGFTSSDSAASANLPTDPDDDVDSDDEGIDPEQIGGDVMSQPILLYPTLEPIETELGSEGHGTTEDGPIADIDSNLTVDFGFYTLSLGNQVFFDTDNSGTMDEGEEGIAEVAVHLVNADGVIIASTTTNEDGQYHFSGFAEGDYQVMVDESNFADGATLAGNYSSTGNDNANADGAPVAPDADDVSLDGDDNGYPEDGNNTALWTEPVSIAIGEEPVAGAEVDVASGFEDIYDANSNLTVDFGVYSASLTTVLWIDDNNDGVADPGEEPLAGVIVNLLGEVVATTTSGADGTIEFDGLPEGSYQLEIVAENFAPGGALDGYFSTSGNAGIDSGNDPDELGGAVLSDPFDVTACSCPTTNIFGENADAVFGFTTEASVGGTSWSDTDGDGVQDAGELGLGSVTINLLTEESDLVTTTVTASDGTYELDVPPGDYVLEFKPPSGYTASPAGAGSDVSASTGLTSVITLLASDASAEVNAGFTPITQPVEPTAPSGPLAFTGGDSRTVAGLGAVLVLLGMAMVAVTRRRRFDHL